MNVEECFKRGLLKKSSYPEGTVKKEIENAHRHLENAIKCTGEKMYDLSVVSVYTSMFHAARAILIRDGVKERSHVCLIRYLEENVPAIREQLAVLDSYRRNRHTMLYGLDVHTLEEDASFGIEQAYEFIDTIERELKKG